MNFTPKQTLIIGYGNTLRSDDGAGQWVANQVKEWNLTNVRSLSCHQLTPELADEIRQATQVIFVDVIAIAANTVATLEIKPIQPAETPPSIGHSSDPNGLLALTQAIYHYSPQAWWLLIPAINFDFGEEFSTITQQGIEAALDQIQQLIENHD
jgi:hydrogenase maturation protease